MMCLKNKNFEQSLKSILGTVKTNPKWVWYPISDKNYAVEPLYKIWLSKADLQNMGTKSLRDLDKNFEKILEGTFRYHRKKFIMGLISNIG